MQSNSLFANLLLATGTLIGIALAASGLLDSESSLSSNNDKQSVAEVNGIDIPQSQYESIAKGISNNKNKKLNSEEHAFILQRLIDEELLVQRGQELGLLQLNSVLRSNMIQAVNATIISENASLNPSENELKKFYENNKNYFRPASKINFDYMRFTTKDQADTAQQALADGQSFTEVKNKFSEQEITKIPNGLLSTNSIRQYFGPTLTEQVMQLPLQEVSPLIASNNGENNKWYLFFILEKELGETPKFEDIKTVVVSEFKRQENDKAIHQYLLWLRKRASIEQVDAFQLENIVEANR